MKISDIKDLVVMAAVIAAIYYVYKGFKKASEPGGFLDTYVAAPIAAGVSAMTLPGDVNVLGYIVLPNGNRIQTDNVYVNSKGEFTWNSKTYRITGRNPGSSDYNSVAV